MQPGIMVLKSNISLEHTDFWGGYEMTPELLLRYLAIVFLFVVVMGATCVVGLEIIIGNPLSPYAFTIIGTALGYAMTIGGVLHGTTLSQNATNNAIQETSNMTTVKS